MILVKFPFSNLSDYKIRPAIIISGNEFNSSLDVWVCPATSVKTSHCTSLTGAIAEGKLEKESFAKTSVIATIEKDQILKKIGKINQQKTGEIIEKIIQNLKQKN